MAKNYIKKIFTIENDELSLYYGLRYDDNVFHVIEMDEKNWICNYGTIDKTLFRYIKEPDVTKMWNGSIEQEVIIRIFEWDWI